MVILQGDLIKGIHLDLSLFVLPCFEQYVVLFHAILLAKNLISSNLFN